MPTDPQGLAWLRLGPFSAVQPCLSFRFKRSLMEVRIYPNLSRPDAGLKPKQESQRPLLPQHARHCPVLEAGSSLGFLTHPPLNENEAFYVEYRGDGRYEFKFFMSNATGGWGPIFSVTWTLPMGSVGMMREEVQFAGPDPGVTEEGALRMARAFVVPEDFGTPPGAITLRGAYNFKTPEGWDSVYTPVLNMVDRPVAPMLIVRVETDWYAHQTEFRYVLQPGEGLPGSHNLPIGQVHFVPREEVSLVDCNSKEIEEIRDQREQFNTDKAELRTTTRFGLEYSPHYSKESRSR
jgi:hypothetical protein